MDILKHTMVVAGGGAVKKYYREKGKILTSDNSIMRRSLGPTVLNILISLKINAVSYIKPSITFLGS